jgi:hypothetical protein
MNEIELLQQRVRMLEDMFQRFIFSDNYAFDKTVNLRPNVNLVFGNGSKLVANSGDGTQIGTAPTQKLGFFGETPVEQQGAITTPSGGGTSATDAIDISGRVAIGQIKTALDNLGFTE